MRGPEHKSFLVLVGLVSFAFAWILWPLFGTLFWAVVIAILFDPDVPPQFRSASSWNFPFMIPSWQPSSRCSAALLQLLNVLIDLGDRRAAAFEEPETFRATQTADGEIGTSRLYSDWPA